MLEPYEEAERREDEWDRNCAAAPRCCRCNGSVYPHETYLEIDGIIYCDPCVAYGTKYVDDLEV